MRISRTAALVVALLFLPYARGELVCGTIDDTGATIASGAAPTQGLVTVDPCLPGGSPPSIPPIGALGTIGDMTGDMPAFPGAGTGADGAYHATADTDLAEGTYDYTTFTIDDGVTVTYTGSVTIHTTGNADLAGTLTTTTQGASVTFLCGGDFAMSGTSEVWAQNGPIDISVNGVFSSTGATRIYANGRNTVTVTVHGTSPAPDGFEVQIAGRLGTGSEYIVVRALGDILVDGGDLGSGEGGVLIQSRQGSLKTSNYARIWGGESPGVYLEALTGVEITDETSVEPGDGVAEIKAFDGDLLVTTSSTVSGWTAALHAAGMVKVHGALVRPVRDLEIVAFGGAATPGQASDPDVQIGPEPADGSGGGSIESSMGDIHIRAAQDVVLSGNGWITTDGGAIDVRAFADFRIEGNGKLGQDPGATRPIEVHASNAIDCMVGDSTAQVLGSEVRLYSGDGGTEMDIPSVEAEQGPVVLLSEGPVHLIGLFEAAGDLTVSTTHLSVDLQFARLGTLDQTGTASGSILVECWGAGGTIDARSATVQSGDSDDESGSVTLAVHERDTEPAVEAFFLPKRVIAKQNARKPEKSKLIAAGFFDLGPDEVDLTTPATLTVGGFEFDVPGLTAAPGGKYVHVADGLTFLVKPHRTGSSRAKFKLLYRGDLTGKVDPDSVVEMRFTNDAVDGRGAVTLTKGRYSHRKVRGTLVAPNLYLTRTKARLKGAGKDSLLLVIGIATEGNTPEAEDVTVEFAGTKLEMEAGDFTRAGDCYTYRGAPGGVTLCRLDYAREQMIVKAKGLDLGALPEGPQAVLVTLTVGADERAVSVRMVRKGKGLKY